jgi:hypothetical protein
MGLVKRDRHPVEIDGVRYGSIRAASLALAPDAKGYLRIRRRCLSTNFPNYKLVN